MTSSHQLPSPPPSEREGSVSVTPRLCGNMPLDYAIETDVKPIVRDFRTGAVLDPGGAGDKYVVDRRGKRVPYEILPDGTPSPLSKRTRIKSEPATSDRLQTVDIKSEDESEIPNRILTIGVHDPSSRGRAGSSHRRAAQATIPPRPRTPCPSSHGRTQKRQARDSPSDDDSSDGAESSSSEDDSSDEDSSSEDSSSLASTDSSIVSVSSIFRPSRSPSRFADTPSPITRSRQVDRDEHSSSNAPLTCSPSSKMNRPSQATSVPRPPSLSFYIPIRQTDCQGRSSSHLPPCLPSPGHAESTVSPATSRDRGWNPINKKKKTPKHSKSKKEVKDSKAHSSDAQPTPTAPSAMLAPAQSSITPSRHYRAATAGPSKGPHGPHSVQDPSVHSSQKIKESRIAKPSSQFQGSSTHRSPKGKEVDTTTIENVALRSSINHHCESKTMGHDRDKDQTKNQDDHNNQHPLKKKKQKKNKWQKLRAEKKAKKQQQIDVQANISTRHGPPRQARIERSIEDTPGPGLPTPGPSSSTSKPNTHPLSHTSPARSESGMFVTSPMRPTAPGSLSQQTPPRSLTPVDSSPPIHNTRKRSRSVYENADDAAIGAVANKILERFERKAQEIEALGRLGREQLEQEMEQERVERQRLEHGWEQQFARTRDYDRAERERLAIGLEEKMTKDRKEAEVERNRAMAELETRITTLQGQLQSQGSRHDAQYAAIQGQFDGQGIRNNATVTHLENNTTKGKELQRCIEDLARQQRVNQELINDRLLRLEAATLPVGAAPNHQAPAQVRTSSAQRPHIREVRPREACEWLMHGRRPGVIPNTLIRSDHGKPNPRTLPPRRPRNLEAGGSSSSRPAQPAARHSNASTSSKPNEGAQRQNRANINVNSVNYNNSTPRAQHQSRPLPAQPQSDITRTATESCSQPVPSAGQGTVIQPLPEVNTQPSSATASSPAAPATEPSSALPGLPRLTHEEVKMLVFNHPLSGLDLSIDYDKDTDGTQTTAATAFLLNAPQLLVATRFRAFINRPAFAFDLDDPAVRAKGCWAVRAGGQQDTQFKLYYHERNYAFTLNRVAVRMWHGEDSVLRLLLSKDHKAVHLCHNKRCFNPDHIVVESRKEHMDRSRCVRQGRCEGHRVWSKCGQIGERRRCIFS